MLSSITSFLSMFLFWTNKDLVITSNNSTSLSASNTMMTTIPCLPKKNKQTFLIIGQDLFSIQDYIIEQYNYTLHNYIKKEEQLLKLLSNQTKKQELSLSPPSIRNVLPNGFMAYTDIQSLLGLEEPIDYGTGIEYANGLLSTVSTNYEDKNTIKDPVVHDPIIIDSMQIGLWLNGTAGCYDIINGILDIQIQKLLYYCIHQYRVNIIYLRIGYEFDNPSFGYSNNPELYKLAYQYIVNYCYNRYPGTCQKKMNFVWHSWAAGLPYNTTLDDFYPGDTYVHWIGISIFNQFYPNSTLGNINDLKHVIQYADIHHKPIMIAESTPFGGIIVNHKKKRSITNTDNIDMLNHHRPNDPWNEWFKPTLKLIRKYNSIKMWSYINCNWDQQSMWSTSGFGDTRIHSNTTIMKLWNKHVIDNKFFKQMTNKHKCNSYPITSSKKKKKKKKKKKQKGGYKKRKHVLSNTTNNIIIENETVDEIISKVEESSSTKSLLSSLFNSADVLSKWSINNISPNPSNQQHISSSVSASSTLMERNTLMIIPSTTTINSNTDNNSSSSSRNETINVTGMIIMIIGIASYIIMWSMKKTNKSSRGGERKQLQLNMNNKSNDEETKVELIIISNESTSLYDHPYNQYNYQT